MDRRPRKVVDSLRMELGRSGEDAALRLYAAAGFRMVARNWRCALGEIDLVLERGALLVFCEVKTRRGDRLGGPFESVTAAKQRKLRQLGEAFLTRWPAGIRDVRFDVASVSVGRAGRPSVHVFEAAF
jgi:putative endonuclease